MPSENAKAVAQEVIRTVGKGRKVSMRKIIKNQGYAQSIADNPKKVVETDSYQSVINPVVKKMEEERDAVIARMQYTRDKAKYRDLMDGLDKLTKNIQLLSGGKTSNDEVKITWE